jgi:hypothetical protein
MYFFIGVATITRGVDHISININTIVILILIICYVMSLSFLETKMCELMR